MTVEVPGRSWVCSALIACAGIALTSSCSLLEPSGIGHDRSQNDPLLSVSGPEAANRQRSLGKPSDAFPNILLQTQEGKSVRFYDDLVKGKAVLVNFIYTGCQQSCSPATANLARVYALLGDRIGRDVILLSISLDPTVDRPKNLKEYAARFGQFHGWYFLTGNEAELDHLRRSLGLYDPDPARDADKTQHAGIVVVGNDQTNRWVSLPVLMDARQLTQTVLRVTRNRG